MIVIYPMLTSGSISPNVLPGVVKAVEKYILLYNTDEVLRAAGTAGTAGKILSTGAQMAGAILTASKDNSDEKGSVVSEAPSWDEVAASQKKKEQTQKAGEKAGKAGEILAKSRSGDAKPSLDLPRSDAVSLEPTWLQVTTAKKGLQILGVKVIPFKISGGTPVTDLLAQDQAIKSLQYLTTKYGRGIKRVFARIANKFKKKPLSGNVESDIIYAETQYGKNMFLALNQLDLEESNIFSSPAGIQKLHKLGWASFIIMDDVNKRATFCMKEFGGICSVVPYGFMFASLGKEHAKVYDDLEDIKRTSGPFFNMRTNRKKVFGEGNISTVDKYLQLIQGKDDGR